MTASGNVLSELVASPNTATVEETIPAVPSRSKWIDFREEVCRDDLGCDGFEWNTWRSACTLETQAGKHVYGCLCEVKSKGNILYLFVTTYKTLSTISHSELNSSVLIGNIQVKTLFIELKRDSIVQVWPSRQNNVGIVELSAEFASDCKSQDLNFMKLGSAQQNDKARN